jgi:hypothetical protein
MHRPMSHLWTQVFAQLKHHVRPGETPLDALNGILREVYGGAAITTAASIRTRTLTPAEVDKLRLGPDVRMTPHDRKPPIVVVRVGHRACVDGNKRVRAWKRDPTDGLDAIVIG